MSLTTHAYLQADQDVGTPAELQKKTVKYVKDRHHSADSSTSKEPQEPGVSTQNMKHNGPDVPQAPYTRDEIDGPLKNAHAGGRT